MNLTPQQLQQLSTEWKTVENNKHAKKVKRMILQTALRKKNNLIDIFLLTPHLFVGTLTRQYEVAFKQWATLQTKFKKNSRLSTDIIQLRRINSSENLSRANVSYSYPSKMFSLEDTSHTLKANKETVIHTRLGTLKQFGNKVAAQTGYYNLRTSSYTTDLLYHRLPKAANMYTVTQADLLAIFGWDDKAWLDTVYSILKSNLNPNLYSPVLLNEYFTQNTPHAIVGAAISDQILFQTLKVLMTSGFVKGSTDQINSSRPVLVKVVRLLRKYFPRAIHKQIGPVLKYTNYSLSAAWNELNILKDQLSTTMYLFKNSELIHEFKSFKDAEALTRLSIGHLYSFAHNEKHSQIFLTDEYILTKTMEIPYSREMYKNEAIRAVVEEFKALKPLFNKLQPAALQADKELLYKGWISIKKGEGTYNSQMYSLITRQTAELVEEMK